MSLGEASFSSSQAKKIEIEPLKPVKTVTPKYPEALKDEGIAGVVVIWAGIDRDGNVRHPSVFRHLHPVLDNLALEAVSQWIFEPYFYGGEPIPFLTYLSVVFEPGAPLAENEPASGLLLSDDLRSILDRCADYCLRLDAAARFYTCHETIDVSVKHIVEEAVASIVSAQGDSYSAGTVYRYPALAGAVRNSTVSDYQLINKGGRFAERRIPVVTRRPAAKERDQTGNGMFIPPLAPIAVPTRLLAEGFRAEFFYSIADEDKVRGRKCFVIGIKPKRKRSSDFLSGKVWADIENHRILKTEVEWAALALDDRIVSECRRYHLTPHMIAVHDYEVEKNGLLYPSRSEIKVEYTGLVRPPQDTKAKLDIRYEKYRFFAVDTESKIIR
jgi:protein TonB